MKVLHLSNVIGHQKGGGIHEVVSNLYKYQGNYCVEPHIWYLGYPEDASSIGLAKNIECLDTYGNSKHGVLKDLFKLSTDEAIGFDILHQHGLWTPVSMYSCKLKKQINLKKVVQPHGFLMPYSRNLSKRKKQIAYSLFEKSNLESADMLVACAKDEARVLRELFPYKDISIIPNGISDEFHNTERRNSYACRKRRLLFLSQVIPVKGLERVINSISEIGLDKFREWEFIIAGYENADYKSFLEKLIHELNLGAVIKIIGPRFGIDKMEMFDNADAFVLPSYSENFGIVVAEALSRGLPVLTTKGTPWQELETNNCGFWVDNTERGIQGGIMQILESSEEELKNMGSRGKKLVSENYLWSKSSKKTVEMYNWMIYGGQKPSFINNF